MGNLNRGLLAKAEQLQPATVPAGRVATMRGRFLVGYFASVDAIHDQGRPIELADVLIEGG
jgi:hypothetical protein